LSKQQTKIQRYKPVNLTPLVMKRTTIPWSIERSFQCFKLF